MRALTLKSLVLVLIISFSFTGIRADEGMWIPTLLKHLNEADMQSKGLKLSAEDIYSVNSSSLKDAIVHFNGGCTGEIISNDGLLITNHHCGYGQIQSHSTVERDYLTDGFWAMSRDEELPNEGLYVTFIVRMEDVTEKILSGVDDEMKARDRNIKIKNNIKELSAAETKGTRYEAVIKPFYFGNQYYMSITETFTDIRLVGAPPTSIGEFGGDTDNWMWPRHTGDFSIFRIYANAENKPAKYSVNNVPYKPKHHFPVNIEGIEEGDFTMVFGFPGRTNEYLSSYALDYVINVHNPQRIAFRDKTLTILEADMMTDPEVKLKYSHKKKGVSNSYKRFKGEIKGLNKLNAIVVKQELEKKFTEAAVNSPPHTEKYGKIISQLENLYQEQEKYAMARAYFLEFMYYSGPDMLNYAVGFRPIVGQLASHSKNKEQVDKAVAKLKLKSKTYFRNLHLPTEKKLFAQLLQVYYENVDKSLHGKAFELLEGKFKMNYEKFTNYVYSKTSFVNKEKCIGILQKMDESAAASLKKDVGYQVMNAIATAYYQLVKPKYVEYTHDIDQLSKFYVEGLQILLPNEKKYYPDANSTLRLSYGKVTGSKPRDGVVYEFYTTLDGIIEKHDPDNLDYVLPEKLIEIYNKKDYGTYARNGEIRVCFTASNHTTGGNSGSPVLNGEGHLIGVNFDRSWESTMSDMMFDEARCRNISVDMNYVLFIIDKYAGAGHLIEEMTVISRESKLRDEIVIRNSEIVKDATNAAAYNKRGLAYFSLGEVESAFIDFSRAAELDPTAANYLFNKATIMAMNNEFQEAKEMFSKAIEANPEYAEAYYNRGKINADLNILDEAIQDFTKAIQINPDYSQAYNNRGVAKNILTGSKEGRADMKKAMELGSERARLTYENWCE
ncbi:MAG: S46 family peptidase [Flavobacteriales bacterium]|nr:S46 family peptidase [Flavobacteriales bacterium]